MRQIPFFVMPGVALSHLREELDIVEGEHRARLMLYRYGQRCGRALVQSYGLSCKSMSEVRSMIEPIWMEAGLSRISVQSAEEADMVVNLEDSIEAKEGRTCDFARGYLSGIVSELTDKRFEVDEVECASEGYLACVLQAYEVVDNLKASNKEELETARKYSLDSGYSYLIKEEIPDQAFVVAPGKMEAEQTAHQLLGGRQLQTLADGDARGSGRRPQRHPLPGRASNSRSRPARPRLGLALRRQPLSILAVAVSGRSRGTRRPQSGRRCGPGSGSGGRRRGGHRA